MAAKINRRIAIDNDDSKVARSLTDKPPAHFTLKVDSFSLLYKVVVTYARVESYESEVFEAGGYKWKLSLYPNGDNGNNAEGYISLYLEIADPQDLPQDWEVTANLKFFVYDHLKKKYLTIQDANATASRFDMKKTGFGIARVLPLCSFWYAGNGYIVNDKCIFGAEILVQNYIGTGCTVENLAMVKAPFTWKIEKFSSLSQQSYLSDVFTIGNRNWKFLLYPKGDWRAKKNTLSVYLVAQDFELFPERKTFAKFELRTVNQCRGKDMKMQSFGRCYSKTSPSWGYSAFCPLADLHDASKGFLINDTLIIQAEVELFSPVTSFSKTTGSTDPPSAKVLNGELTDIMGQNFSGIILVPVLKANQVPQTKVQNQGKIQTRAGKETKLPQAKVKKEKGLTQTKGKSSPKKSGSEAPKESKSRKPWFKRWFF